VQNTIFQRLAAGRPAPPTEEKPKVDPAQRLLTWLLQGWPGQTINSKQLYQYAPKSIRPDRESAIKTAEVLVKCKWLVPLPTRRRNERLWQILRKEPIIHPKVEG